MNELFVSKYASQKSEIAYQVNEQSRYLTESNDLKEEVRQGSKIKNNVVFFFWLTLI